MPNVPANRTTISNKYVDERTGEPTENWPGGGGGDLSNYYTKAQSDSRYYTRSETNNRFLQGTSCLCTIEFDGENQEWEVVSTNFNAVIAPTFCSVTIEGQGPATQAIAPVHINGGPPIGMVIIPVSEFSMLRISLNPDGTGEVRTLNF